MLRLAGSPSERSRIASARSSRSLPQNNSPSGGDEGRRAEDAEPLRLVGLLRAAAACWRRTARRRGRRRGRRFKPRRGSPISVAASSIRRPSANCGAEHRDGRNPRPSLAKPDQRDPRRQQAVLRERLGPPERQREVGAQPFQVAPHVAALGLVEIERRGVPALGLEDRPEQERPEAHGHAGLRRPAARSACAAG